MSKVSIKRTLNHPIQDLYDVISDYCKYPEFLTEIKTVQRSAENSKRIAFTLEFIKTFNYVLDFKEVSPTEISWKMVDSNLFKKNSGKWKLKKKGEKTEVTYSLDVEFGFFAPSMIVNKMVKKDLPRVVERMAHRVEQLSA